MYKVRLEFDPTLMLAFEILDYSTLVPARSQPAGTERGLVSVCAEGRFLSDIPALVTREWILHRGIPDSCDRVAGRSHFDDTRAPMFHLTTIPMPVLRWGYR
jgi:hypothetical protein